MLLDGVSERVNQILEDVGITTLDALRALSRDDLLDLDGIGPVTADTILATLADLPPLPVDMSTPRADELVTVINVSGGLVLIGERYLFPNQTRVIRRDQIRDGLTILGE